MHRVQAEVVCIPGIYYRRFIYNINKKGARVCIFIGEEIIVLIRIKEIYIGILENCLSVIIIEYIFVNRNIILFAIIIPSIRIIISWFNNNITRYEFIIISESGYRNKNIYII
jgi:hypothetical protein